MTLPFAASSTSSSNGDAAGGASGHGVVLPLVTLSSFCVPFLSTATNVALPDLARELGIAAPLLPWVNMSYLLAATALLLPMGRLVDLRHKRPLFIGGLALLAVTTAFAGFAPSQGWLFALRALQGAAGAIPLAAAMPLVVASCPPEMRGRALGINVAGVYTGLSVGPVAGGLLTHTLGWRSIFWLAAALIACTAVAAAARLPRERSTTLRAPFDGLGGVLSAASLCALMLGLARLPAPLGLALVGASAVGLALFAAWELRVASPLLDVRLLRDNRVFLFSNLAALVNYCATAGIGFLLSLWLQQQKGLDPRGAGLALMVQPVIMAVLSAPAGRLSDRVEPRLLASAGMGLAAVALGGLATIGPDTDLWKVVVALAVLGLAFALFSSPNTNAIMGSVERRHLGIASATVGTMRGVGQMLSLGLSGLLFTLYIGDVHLDHAHAAGFLSAVRLAFAIFAVLCALGIFASLARGRVKRV